MPTAKDKQEINVIEVKRAELEFCVLGTAPFICNRMSEKAKHELLFPRGKKNAAERASTMKHNPIEEFRDSPYVLDEGAPTLLATLATGFKKAMGTAALDLPDVQRAQVLRLLWVETERVALYGIPKLFMAVTRSADIKKTPDVRTRAILPRWACRLKINYLVPLLRPQTVANLLGAAGFTAGVGDWRQEKGSGSYGMFRIVPADNPEFQAIIKMGGRKAQLEAMDAHEPYDNETAELLTWFEGEQKRRGFTKEAPSAMVATPPHTAVVAAVATKSRRRNGSEARR